MSFARLFISFACLVSLFGCAVTETRTTKHADGSTTTETKQAGWVAPRYAYAPGIVVAPAVPYGTYVPPVYVAPQNYGSWALPIWTNGVLVCRGGRARLINRRCYFY